MPSKPPMPSQVYRECLRCMLVRMEDTNGKAKKGSDSSSSTRAKTKVSYATIVVSCTDNDRTNRRVSSREEQ